VRVIPAFTGSGESESRFGEEGFARVLDRTEDQVLLPSRGSGVSF